MQPKVIADFETQLATAIAVSDTTFELASATDDDGVALPNGFYYFTVDNGQNNKEYFSGTLTGTSVTGVKNVSRQGVETSGAARAHRVGASVIITDFATYLAYMNNGFASGTVDATEIAKGVVQLGTQTEVDAGTETGSTGATLVASPDKLRARKYHDYAADAGSTDAYAITVAPAITAYSNGQVFVFKANTANTGAATLNVNALGPISIKKTLNVDLVTGDIVANQIVEVVYDGTNFQVLSPLSGLTNPIVNVYTTTSTWTKPANLKYVVVELVGGGAGGGGCDSATDLAASGGGAGGYSKKKIDATDLGATETVTIGLNGTGGIGNNDGTNGGTTSFGAHCQSTGGVKGLKGASGSFILGGVSGTPTGGDINIPGEQGGYGIGLSSAGDVSMSGEGGNSKFGYGGRGRASQSVSGEGDGIAASGYGAGGGGALQSTSTSARTGGVGTPGLCIVTEYYN